MFQNVVQHRRISTTIALFCALILFSCGDDDNDSTTNPPVQVEHVSFPLQVGHVWNFDRQTTEGLASAEAYSLEITGTREIAGETYFTIVDEEDDSPSETYLRQSGHKLWVVPEEFLDGEIVDGDTLTEWMQEQAASSFPWKYSDTDAAVGVPWTIFEASGKIVVNEFAVDISITITGTHLGSRETTVPAGSFTTSRTLIQQNTVLIASIGTFTLENSQEFEIADGVGLVRVHEIDIDPITEENETEESKLISYTLAP